MRGARGGNTGYGRNLPMMSVRLCGAVNSQTSNATTLIKTMTAVPACLVSSRLLPSPVSAATVQRQGPM
jgi:hypothetical protein